MPSTVAVLFRFGIVLSTALLGWLWVRLWVPGGRIRPTLAWYARQSSWDAQLSRASLALVLVLLLGQYVYFGTGRIGLVRPVATATLGGGLLTIALVRGNRSRSELLAAAETTSPGNVVSGPVCVSGRIEVADREVTTPFTGTTAVAYLAVASQYRTVKRFFFPRVGTSFVTWIDRGCAPFYVADETGRVLVDPENAWLLPDGPPGEDTAGNDGARGAIEEVVVEPGDRIPDGLTGSVEHTDGVADLPTVCRELRLERGDRVTVLGTAGSEHGTTVVSGDSERTFTVAGGPRDALTASIRSGSARWKLYYGVVLTLLGTAGLVATLVL